MRLRGGRAEPKRVASLAVFGIVRPAVKPNGVFGSARALLLGSAVFASSAMGCARVHPPPTFAATAGPDTSPAHPLLADAAAGQPSGLLPGAPPIPDDEEEGEEGEEHGEAFGPHAVATPDVDAEDGGIDDLPDAKDPHPTVSRAKVTSPLAGLSETELRRRVKDDLPSLGSISYGPPNRGRLINGVQMQVGPHHQLTAPTCAWGTEETVKGLTKAIDKVYEKYPSEEKLIVGHISSKFGGKLKPHKSHQSGRDVDVSYFYKETKSWYAVANEKNLDRERTWAFVKALLTEARIEMIFIDSSLQKALKDYAVSKGEDQEWLDEIFQYGGKSRWPIIRHIRGHATHIHVRFLSPEAQANAAIAAPYLPRRAKATSDDTELASTKGAKPGSKTKGEDGTTYVMHKARNGDTLDSLARKYGTTVAAIREANALRGNAIKMKHTYRIPVKSVAKKTTEPETRQRRGTAKQGKQAKHR